MFLSAADLSSSTVLLAALGVVSAAMAGLIWVIKFLFTQMVPTMERNTEVTLAADRYLRLRNGRDAEVHKEVLSSLNSINKSLLNNGKIKRQEVKEQHIDKQVIHE